MPSQYQPRPKVVCHSCQAPMTKRRNSKSGYYYCSKPECQSARRAEWMKERSDVRVRELEQKIELLNQSAAKLITAIRGGHNTATCPECGFADGVIGFAHFNREGEGCPGLGMHAGRVHIEVAAALWPEADRVYHETARV